MCSVGWRSCAIALEVFGFNKWLVMSLEKEYLYHTDLLYIVSVWCELTVAFEVVQSGSFNDTHVDRVSMHRSAVCHATCNMTSAFSTAVILAVVQIITTIVIIIVTNVVDTVAILWQSTMSLPVRVLPIILLIIIIIIIIIMWSRRMSECYQVGNVCVNHIVNK